MKQDITPQIWRYFDEICRIPRASKKEEKICAYIKQFADKHSLSYKQDKAGNILIMKKASPGNEHRATVILQSHVDMVCEKNNDVSHNFDTDPIDNYIDGDWMKARGTTLGADNGLGMAAMLTTLADTTISHGPLEAFFTVDEETGLTGANALENNFLTGNTLINLDGDNDEHLLIGCAGGINMTATLKYEPHGIPPNSTAYKISLSGLSGGHSGDDINKRRGNAIKIQNQLLLNCSGMFGISVNKFEGGNLHNAIPREATATIFVDNHYCYNFEQYCINEMQMWKEALVKTSPDFSFSVVQCVKPSHIIDIVNQSCLLNALSMCPSGVITMSKTIQGLVSTSSNLASIKFEGRNKIIVTTSQRSDDEEAKRSVNQRIRRIFAMIDANVENSCGYPGWKPNLQSPVLNITQKAFIELFGKTPTMKAIHAGLECGLFLEKYPNLDMISIGPTIKDAHSPNEKLSITSVKRFSDLLIKVLEEI